ncbi:LppP/LprE family lipoprotein [Streptomyces sp. NPDC127166]|uniref:LppP/LprE family lipoprotein n=1 Tax=Streptomyces sp. NPDC127166 TaxID=3345380 RepID=UPI00363AA7B3
MTGHSIQARILTLCVALLTLLGLSTALSGTAAAAPGPCSAGGKVVQVAPRGQVANSTPVLFVHGIAAGADTWNGPEAGYTADKAQKAGEAGKPKQQAKGYFPVRVAKLARVTAWTYDYSAAQPEWVTDNRIGPALADAINCLARTTGHKVVVVGHSMGGLATKYAASRSDGRSHGKTWQNIAEVITIATPTLGSKSIMLLQALPDFIGRINKPTGLAFEAVYSFCAGYGLTHDDNICSVLSALKAPQGRALRYRSHEISKLPPWPRELPVRAIAGDIRYVLPKEPFDVGPPPEADLGDIAVTLDSATAYANKTGKPHVLTCRSTGLGVLQGGCNHVNIKTHPVVMATVIRQIERIRGTRPVKPVDENPCPTRAELKTAITRTLQAPSEVHLGDSRCYPGWSAVIWGDTPATDSVTITVFTRAAGRLRLATHLVPVMEDDYDPDWVRDCGRLRGMKPPARLLEFTGCPAKAQQPSTTVDGAAARRLIERHDFSTTVTAEEITHMTGPLRAVQASCVGSANGNCVSVFFFYGNRYVGQATGSGQLRLASQNGTEAVLARPIFKDTDPTCCPSGGTETHRVRWGGNAVVASPTLPYFEPANEAL